MSTACTSRPWPAPPHKPDAEEDRAKGAAAPHALALHPLIATGQVRIINHIVNHHDRRPTSTAGIRDKRERNRRPGRQDLRNHHPPSHRRPFGRHNPTVDGADERSESIPQCERDHRPACRGQQNRRRATVSRTWVRHPGARSHEHKHREHHHVHDDDAAGGPAAPDPAAAQARPDQRGAAGETTTTRLRHPVLRTLARTHQGRPATHIHATLRSSLTPLGVRLTPATLRALAVDIAAGRPVELP